MSPAFERRLARIDKAFDRTRHARDAEEGRLGLAKTYLRMATVMCVYEKFGEAAAEWVLSGEGPPPAVLAEICGTPQDGVFHREDTKNTEEGGFGAEDAEDFAENAEGSCRGEAAISHSSAVRR